MSNCVTSFQFSVFSFQKSAHARLLFCILNTAYFLLLPTHAQEDAELPPPPKRPGVRITFVPPPLKGTLSLGIFNKAGTLVRTLHREATTKEFVVGLNGLITWWDGKDDAGALAPNGNYSVRGYAVGAVEFEGIAFHFNDWIVDEKSRRIRRVEAITPWGGMPNDTIFIDVTLADGKKGSIGISELGPSGSFLEPMANWVTEKERETAAAEGIQNLFKHGDKFYGLREGQIVAREGGGWSKIELMPVENVTNFVPMSEGDRTGWWLIDKTAAVTEVKRFAADGTFVRSLAIPPTEPQPFALCADAVNEKFLILLEEAPGLQRVRILQRRITDEPEKAGHDAPKSSEWAVTMSKTIRASDNLADVRADLKTEVGEPFAAIEKINVRLLPNQLVRNAITNVDVDVAADAKGCFLRTADGLPLKRITETPGLKWVAMMKETAGKGVTIFQSDGAVVEEFKARKLANMMAFDAGDYEWAGK